MPDEGRSRPKLDSQRLALIVQHVADHHLRTLRYQQAGLRGPRLRAPPLTSTTLLSKRAIRSPDYQRGSLADRTAWFKNLLVQVRFVILKLSGGAL